ncbi:LpxL/LpxP family Kdo(2)-lipid IV(A) lauroyl/palmitoleoyl acyltransferase [Photobacterium sp. 2_MG-2023]|uniref:LpxL/LpxP family Kdo(2)-lipid IV(A) lauroyl/palmitoleoyl acyltransferase n=1 Tax=Photobacterium sp. 2_MG-2023 TaxID=3062663 RepID=UPI0026E14157|nr:LpxL/LpxP family Kdo(2)-lipid IV(A) lauroyl/palmitoleoyl acyltransferase [Photobacterium sp. 2_MG-2023]MDO6582350.1 LpxL/LpxP family Kdo(2)-lipid IV(A) lauroyl/palmitoleoyl acyltransferase [Photobacterium sp. 2_MG-2023]
MSKLTAPEFKAELLHPRYWPTLLMIGTMKLISLLPYRIQFLMGKGVGRLAIKLLKKRRYTIERNLELCFPDMPKDERDTLIKKNIDNAGLALFETGMAWFWPEWRVKRHIRFEGVEYLDELDKQGKGVLLVAVHSMNLEVGARAFGLRAPGVGVYRPNNNPCFDYFQFKGRVRSNRYMLDRKDVKGMFRALREGERVWYAPDHDYGRRRSTFAPLFAVDKACTTVGTSLLVDATDCAIVPIALVRDTDDGMYTLRVFKPLEDFPHNDPDAAAVYINKHAVEPMIMQAPEQYMWLHRRFKTRPEGEASLY